MIDECKKYFDIILEGLSHVEQSYYNLATTYEPSGIVRERAFCYELYHQIRKSQESSQDSTLTLNGEIDKRGNPNFDEEDRKNPDFVFHIPGEMIGNTFIIEVKGNLENSYPDECIKDFETLLTFVEKYDYKMGVFILYNYFFEELLKKLKGKLINKFDNESFKIASKIIIICKKNAYLKSEIHNLQEII